MHPKEFKFLTLDSVADWKRGEHDKVEIRADASLALWSIPKLETTLELPEYDTNPIGLAFKAPDTLFIIDGNNGYLYKYNITDRTIERIFCINKNENVVRQFLSPGGIAISDTMLYVVDSGRHQLQALFLYNYQVRYILGAIDEYNQPISGDEPGEFNHPTDVALDAKENLYIVDQANKRIQKFNKAGQFLTQFGQEGEETLVCPTNITIDSDDFIYIIDIINDRSYLKKYDSEGKCKIKILLEFRAAGLAVDSNKKIYVGEEANKEAQKIHIYDYRGNELGTCPGYRGSVNCLAVDTQDNLYVGFQANNKGQLGVLKSGQTFITQGTYYSEVFDSAIQDCRWHRLVLDADIPAKTRIEISYFVSNSDSPPGSNSYQQAFVNAKDFLLQNGAGRYLWLKIDLFGDQCQTPVIRRLTVYFPRLSYLRYLPAVYQENATSKDFLERFLSIFESFLSETEETIFSITRLFDPFATDSKFVSWLASWLAITVDENWEEVKKRQLISQAYNLYKKRGTKEGLECLVELYCGSRPVIIEHFQSVAPMILEQRSALGINTILAKELKKPLQVGVTSTIGNFSLRESQPDSQELFEHSVYDFTVVINKSQLETKEQLATLRRIIEEEKPAHTRCFIKVVGTEMRIGFNSFIELGSVIAGESSTMQLGSRSVIGRKTILKSRHLMKGIIGIRSEIGINAILN